MSTLQIITAIAINLIIPILGVIFFFKLVKKMRREKILNPPIFELFIVFATYGGLLIVALTTLFWEWSGLASLGTIYLIIPAPIIMVIIAFRNYKLRKTSSYRNILFKVALLYFVIAPITFLSLYLIS